MPTLWIKICGLTRPQDVRAAVQAGADALGVVCYAPSRRAVDPERLPAILAEVPEQVTRVALFVDPDRELVEAVCAGSCVDWLQFHGSEPAEFCASFDRPYIKALSVHEGIDVAQQIEQYDSAELVMLDTYDEKAPGGTGKPFDWRLAHDLPPAVRRRLVLAGGLNSGNVAAAVAAVEPFGVDVSSGVESAPGIKDADKIRNFIEGARNG